MTFWKHLSGRRIIHTPSIPANQRVYAIGDIHGRADLLDKMHQAVVRHAAAAHPAENHIIYLGDYVDRGLQVKEVIDILVSDPLPEFKSVFLKGNHEEMMLDFLTDGEGFEDWISLGGQVTLLSYGVTPAGHSQHPVRPEDIRLKFLEALPKAHYDFLLNLKISCQVGDYLFVHAGLRPGIPLERQDPQDCIRIREPFLSNPKNLGLRVVHGHHITARPEILAQRIGVDTGAYATGRLSCVCLENDRVEVIAVQTDGSQ
jgi:serine/threonine protein phosphatase 1